MSTPGVGQLPIIIFQVPDLHSMVRRGCDNSIAVEVELGSRDEVTVPSVEIGESGRHQGSTVSPRLPTLAGTGVQRAM